MKKRAAFPSGQCTVRSTGRHLLKALQSFVENNTINSDQHSSHLPRSSKMCKNLNVSCGENINRHHTTAVHYSWAIATINLHVSTTHLNKLELKKKLFKNHFYLANAMPLVRCGNDESEVIWRPGQRLNPCATLNPVNMRQVGQKIQDEKNGRENAPCLITVLAPSPIPTHSPTHPPPNENRNTIFFAILLIWMSKPYLWNWELLMRP